MDAAHAHKSAIVKGSDGYNHADRTERSTVQVGNPGAKIARDVATLVIGSFLAAVFGAAAVFVVPRITSVEDFGYWRMFVLYASYVGFFHWGLEREHCFRGRGSHLTICRGNFVRH